MISDWLKLVMWLATSNHSASFHIGENNLFWLVRASHMTCNIESVCLFHGREDTLFWLGGAGHLTCIIQWE